jgi:hypothetical protein
MFWFYKNGVLLILLILFFNNCEGKENNSENKPTKPEVINGYTLPPKPDPKINNATLLGIDSNHNGVRDDVERYIIKRFAKDPKYPKTKTAIAMQYAWAEQKILENPTIDSNKYIDDVIDCQFFWFSVKTKKMPTLEAIKYAKKHQAIGDADLKDKIFNTRERIKREFEFNKACSGHIFNGRHESIKNCQRACKINCVNHL